MEQDQIRKDNQQISAFHLIIWLFWVSKAIENEKSHKIFSIYDQKGVQDDRGKSFSPFISNKKDFQNLLKQIKEKNKMCLLKIVTDQSHCRECLKASKDISDVIQVHLFRVEKNLFQKYHQRYPKLTTQNENFDKLIDEAQKEVVKWTQNYRTFYNSMILAGEAFAEEANRYRFRLFSCMKINISDLQDSLNKFRSFLDKEIPAFRESQFKRYLQSADQYIKKKIEGIKKIELSPQQKLNELKDQQTFFRQVLDTYQKNSYFCHIINSNLRTFKEKISQSWKSLSLPFSNLYQAIKYFHTKMIRPLDNDQQIPFERDPLYTSDFSVFRGGIIRKKELDEFIKHKSKVFVEFFGFLSTSLSSKVVLDRFMKNRHSKSAKQQGKSFNSSIGDNKNHKKEQNIDYPCIFKINCKFNQAIHERKYSDLIHGFFHFDKVENIDQQEVLFNALNVFRLLNVKKMKAKDILTEEEYEAQLKKEKDNPYFEKKNYQEEITVIELNYGDFFDILLQQNPFNLSNAEKIAKENYIFCMNKIRKADWFDISDAHLLNNQAKEAYQYLKMKANQDGNSQNFEVCRVDRKNYFNKLAKIAVKMGKVKEALNMNKISLICYENVKQLHYDQLYYQHYDIVIKMQDQYIQNLKSLQDYRSALEQLEKQYKYLDSQVSNQRNELKKSENQIEKGITLFSVGHLEKSKELFKKSLQKITKVKEAINITLENIQYSCGEFLCDLLRTEGVWSQSSGKYKKVQKLEKELIQNNGGEKKMEEIENKIAELCEIVREFLNQSKKIFKDEAQFGDLIQRNQHSSQISKKYNRQQKTKEEKLESRIKEIVSQIESTNEENTQKITQLMSEFKEKCDELNKYETLKLDINIDMEKLKKVINKFKKDQRIKRIQLLKKKKNQMIRQNQEKWIIMFQKEIQELEDCIDELKNEGFTQNSVPILKKRNQIASLLQKSDQRDDALKKIQTIVKSQLEVQCLYIQLFKAHFTEGKILSNSENKDDIQASLDCFKQALDYVEKSALGIKQEKDNQFQKSILKNKNSCLELKLVYSKTLLKKYFKYHEQEPSMSRCRNLKKDQFGDVLKANAMIQEVRKILQERSKLENLGDLQIDLTEVDAYLEFIKQYNIQKSFSKFEECSRLKQLKLGKNDLSILIMWCEAIEIFIKDKQFVKILQKNEINNVLVEGKKYFIKNPHIRKTIQKSLGTLNKALLQIEQQQDDPFMIDFEVEKEERKKRNYIEQSQKVYETASTNWTSTINISPSLMKVQSSVKVQSENKEKIEEASLLAESLEIKPDKSLTQFIFDYDENSEQEIKK